MGNVFGKEKPLKEQLRENKRVITRAIRELDREKAGLEREEKRLTMEIKKAAREQQMSSVKIMAKVSWIRTKLSTSIVYSTEDDGDVFRERICVIRRIGCGAFIEGLLFSCMLHFLMILLFLSSPFPLTFQYHTQIRKFMTGFSTYTTIYNEIY